MATAAYPVPAFPGLQPQRALARLYADGSAVVQCGTQEFGVKDVGEIGQVGVAIANAIFHATGRRVRELPARMQP